jgi:hypothetical protein
VNAHLGKLAIGAAAICLAVAGIALARGGGRHAPAPAATRPAAFNWVRPSPLPAGWSAQRLPGWPARLPAPAGWRPAAGDPGTRTMILRDGSGRITGYLNATPRQGAETLRNWRRFRVEHNRDEEERGVTLEAAASGLRFRSGTGSCVIDSYHTTSGSRYRELACIVAGSNATTVIVGAAPPSHWAEQAPTIQRAINSFTT